MKKRSIKKKGRRAKKTVARRNRPKTGIVLPKPLAERVEAENPDPKDVSITYPSERDPVVRVRGKVVGSWADL